jgi:hypothetical protein
MDLITTFQKKRVEQQKNDIQSTLSESEHEEYEERAAIMEFDGGLSREEAERQAIEGILAKKGEGKNERNSTTFNRGNLEGLRTV